MKSSSSWPWSTPAISSLGGKASSLTRSAAGKAVSRLENRLGRRLLNRITQTLSFTDEGRTFSEHGARIFAALDEAEASVAGGAGTPRGLMRLTVRRPSHSRRSQSLHRARRAVAACFEFPHRHLAPADLRPRRRRRDVRAHPDGDSTRAIAAGLAKGDLTGLELAEPFDVASRRFCGTLRCPSKPGSHASALKIAGRADGWSRTALVPSLTASFGDSMIWSCVDTKRDVTRRRRAFSTQCG